MKYFKRYFCLMLSLALVFALVGCGNQSAAEQQNTQPDTGANTPDITADSQGTDTGDSVSRVLVVYFSRTGEQYEVGVIDKGNTAIVADMIIDATGADSFEILPADVEYPATYDELTDFAKKEQNEKARPAIAGALPDLSQYDTIFIGAPVWWGDWPMILYTYFEANDFTGKTLIPFSTHAGSGLSGFDRKLESAAPGATVGTGLAIRGKDTQTNPDSVREAVNAWLAELGY